MKNAIRMSDIMKLPVTYILCTTPSASVRYGPTHQPVVATGGYAQSGSDRVFRPADSQRRRGLGGCAMTNNKPTLLVTTRQDLPHYEGSGAQALKGGYVSPRQEGRART
jgi:transketolase